MRPEDAAEIRITSRVADKIWQKHGVTEEEVIELLESEDPPAQVRRSHRAAGSYIALGRTAAGRLLLVAFFPQRDGSVNVATARDMTQAERRLYERS